MTVADELDAVVSHTFLGGTHDLFSIGFYVDGTGGRHACCIICGWDSANWNRQPATEGEKVADVARAFSVSRATIYWLAEGEL